MAGKYAQGTAVTAPRSREDIERSLRRYGVREFGFLTREREAIIVFDKDGEKYKIVVPLPDPNEREYRLTPQGKTRAAKAANDAYDTDVRARWRVLLLLVKAKFEMAEICKLPFSTVFVEYRVLESGQTVAELVGRRGLAALSESN